MKEHGILFKDEMVRALIAGLKTETRRAIKGIPPDFIGGDTAFVTDGSRWAVSRSFLDRRGVGCFPEGDAALRHTFGSPGCTLWVREVWDLTKSAWVNDDDDQIRFVGPASKDPRGHALNDWRLSFRADDQYPAEAKWRSSLLMPRWAARITATLVEVEPQKLGQITEADAAAEGMALVAKERGWGRMPLREVFYRYFAEIHGGKPDDDMPVWVVRFKDVVVGKAGGS